MASSGDQHRPYQRGDNLHGSLLVRDAGLLLSRSRLKQLDGIAVRIFNLNLTPSRASLHLVAEALAVARERVDAARKVRDSQHDAVPAAGLLTLTVRQRTRA